MTASAGEVSLVVERPFALAVPEVEIGLRADVGGLTSLNDLFGSRPLELRSWVLPIAMSIVIFFAVEGLKAVRRRGETFKGAS